MESQKAPAHNFILPIIKQTLLNFNISIDANILDAGCGRGYILYDLYLSGYNNIYGFDMSEENIEVIKKNAIDISNRVEVHNIYDVNLPSHFPIKEFDLILLVEVIEHLFDPKRCLKNIYSWLKDGGYFIVTTPYHGYLKNLAIALVNKFDKHFDTLTEGGHIKFFSKKSLFRMMLDTDLVPFRFTGTGRFPYLWKSMVVLGKK